MSNSLWPHGLQHTRLPCQSSTPGAYSDSCPLSRWCHPTISSSAALFPSCLQSFPAQGLFQWIDSLHQVAKVLKGFKGKHLWKTFPKFVMGWPTTCESAPSTCRVTPHSRNPDLLGSYLQSCLSWPFRY